MNDIMKTTHDALEAAQQAVDELAQRIAVAYEKRASAAADLEKLDGSLAAAEERHTQALAGIELGEKHDIRATAAAVESARKAASSRPELEQQIRVSDAVITTLEQKQRDAAARARHLAEQHQQAVGDALEAQGQAALDNVHELIAAVVDAGAHVDAIRKVMGEVGRPWRFGPIDSSPLTRSLDEAVFLKHVEAVRAELGGA